MLRGQLRILADRLGLSLQVGGDRKWGRPYLNRKFFRLLGERMGDDCLLVVAERDGRPIAGALNMIGGDCLYGRYWGASGDFHSLHFEACYYQGIEYCIRNGLQRFEPGTQGEHKLARGFEPTFTWSAHWVADRTLRAAIASYLAREAEAVGEYAELAAQHVPFRAGT